MPAPPRWLLAVPDAVRQLEAAGPGSADAAGPGEVCFGVSRAWAAQLMRTFGAELAGYVPRAAPGRPPAAAQEATGGGAAFRIETERRHARVVAELRTGARSPGSGSPCRSSRSRRASRGAARGRDGRGGADRGAVRGGEGRGGEAVRAGAGADGRLRALRGAGREGGEVFEMSEALVPVGDRAGDRAARRGRGRAARGDRGRRAGGGRAVPGVLRGRRSPTTGRGPPTGRRRGSSWRGAGLEAWGCGRSRRSTWRPTSGRIPGSVPTVKQHLAAIRALCDWLVVHQVLPVNPAAAVRGPKHVVTKGATPVLTPAEARALLDRIDTGTLRRPPRPGAAERDGLQLRAGECGRGDASPGLLPAGDARVAAVAREGRQAPRRAGAPPGRGGGRGVSRRRRRHRGREGAAVSERRPGGRAERAAARRAGRCWR